MARRALSIVLGIVLACWPGSGQAPASTAGEGGSTTSQLAPIETPTDQPTTADLNLIIPLVGPSVHTNYTGTKTSYVWQDLNSGAYSAYGVEDGRFIYQPSDTWFIYGIFGPIEAVKYDWNVKYDSWGGRHDGIDFAAPVGLPVLAASGGEVIFVGERAGNTIIIQTGNFQITYSHLDSFAVKVGERVVQGQVIGRTGSSGTANPHLHFEIDKYENGQRWGINPMKYLLPELQTAIIPDVPTNRYIDEPLVVWNTPAEDFRW